MTTEQPRIQRVHPGYRIDRDEQHLTLRQREVMSYLARGITSGAEIGAQMGLTRQRVSSLVREIRRKGWVPVKGGWLRVCEDLSIEIIPNPDNESVNK